jgi:hypothetical protein
MNRLAFELVWGEWERIEVELERERAIKDAVWIPIEDGTAEVWVRFPKPRGSSGVKP